MQQITRQQIDGLTTHKFEGVEAPLIDSKQQQLNPIEIITTAVSSLKTIDQIHNMSAAVIPGTDLVQVNNSAFATTRGKKDSFSQFFTLFYNADVLPNIKTNLVDFLSHLQRNKATFGVIKYDNDMYTESFLAMYEELKDKDVKVTLGKSNKNPDDYLAFISMGKKRIKQKGKTE
tara:strand:- start:475 stop:999 length:525 start_codon:yes stop_codon:yes gene_type:complete